MTASTQTHCCYCAMQCAMQLSESTSGVLVEGLMHPINKGKLCVLGQNSAKLFDHGERLTKPLVRKKGKLVEASWDEAIERAVAGFKFLRFKYGQDANAVYSGASISNEKAYLLGKFARLALGTRHVDYNGRYCMSSAAKAALMAFGLDRGLNRPLNTIPEHDVIMIIGSNPAETLPIIMNYFLAAKKEGTKFIVLDPRKTITATFATLHLAVKLGGDLAVANALLKQLIENSKENSSFIASRTRGFKTVKSSLEAITLNELVDHSGISKELLSQTLECLINAKKPLILTGRGNDQNERGVESTLAFINLSLALGANYGTLTGQANGQGAREHGLKADQLAGYRSINDKAARQQIATLWKISESDLPQEGYSAFEILQATATKEIRGMFVLGSNPIVSSPDKDNVKAWLSAMDHLVVVDTFLSETASVADVVLPGSLWAEETGTTTNLEGRVLLRNALREPPKSARTDLSIILELANALSQNDFSYPKTQTAKAIFEELRLASKGAPADYYGITYERLEKGEELFWPCRTESDTGEEQVFKKQFAHEDGKAQFHPIPLRKLSAEPSEMYPLQLTTGRYLVHYLTGNFTRRTPLLQSKRPEPLVEIHPETAEMLGLKDGQDAKLSTKRATARYKVKVSKKIRPNVLFVPIHWEGQQAANRLTLPLLDPYSKMPAFKATAAKLEPVLQDCEVLTNEA